jgi:hydroxyacid-oxoacid transhydrogenase
LDDLGVPRGLEGVGYSKEDIPMLVEGTLPQRRVLDLAPGVGNFADEEGREHLTGILEASLKY